MKTEDIQIVSALVIACTGLLTALCIGVRQLHIKSINSKCFDIQMASSSEEGIKNNIV